MPFLTVNDAKLYYEVFGSGPPLVMVMGLGGNSQVWAPIRQQLASRYQLIMYDMQGTGRSEKLAGPTTRETLMNEVDALLTHLGLERALGLGYSFGASVLLNYAARRPERLQAVSFVAAVYKLTPHVLAFVDIQTELARSLTRSQYLKQAFLWTTSESFFERNPEFLQRMIGFLERSPHGNETGWDAWKQFMVAFDPDYREILRGLSVPTQILHGAADRVSAIESVREAASVNPAIALDVIPRGGHILPWDSPEETAAALLGFYGKHDQALRPAPPQSPSATIAVTSS
jgi:pimeloyl-ACP methyl ester carboxylesterase